jgi:hypothetical protein
VNTIVRCPRTGRACSEGTCRETALVSQDARTRPIAHRAAFETQIPTEVCCAKTRAGAPCIMRVVPGKRRCRFHGGLSTGPRTVEGRARIAEAQRRRWKAFRSRNVRGCQIPSNTPSRAQTRPIAHRAAFETQIPTEVLRQNPSRSPVHHEGGAGKAALCDINRAAAALSHRDSDQHLAPAIASPLTRAQQPR